MRDVSDLRCCGVDSIKIKLRYMNSEQIFENVITQVFNPLYQLSVGIAFCYFLYGAVKYIIYLSHPEKKNEGRSHLLWGTIGLFIMVSIGGILKFFNDFLGGMFTF